MKDKLLKASLPKRIVRNIRFTLKNAFVVSGSIMKKEKNGK